MQEIIHRLDEVNKRLDALVKQVNTDVLIKAAAFDILHRTGRISFDTKSGVNIDLSYTGAIEWAKGQATINIKNNE